MTLLIFVVVLFGLILIGMPIAFSLLATSVSLMFYLNVLIRRLWLRT